MNKIIRQIVVDDIPTEDTGLIVRELMVNVIVGGGLQSFIVHNGTGDLANHSFVLNAAFDWTLGLDANGRVILIPLRK